METEKKTPDWLAIEGEYRATSKSIRAIAEEYGVIEGTIRARAKKGGWVRDPSKSKRAIVNAALSGITHGVTHLAVRKIEEAASEDIQDMERGLRINRMCLVNLETAAESVSEPREIKIIVEAASAAIASIRKIRGLDEEISGALTPTAIKLSFRNGAPGA